MAYRFAPSEPRRLGESLLARIGNTPLLRLQRVTHALPAAVEVYVKAEWFNPGGSVKDRPVLRIIEDAERDGRLNATRTIIDSSSGNAGIAYAMVGAAKGYRVRLFVPANVSEERKRLLHALGADVHYTDPLEGSDGAIVAVREAVASDPGRWFFGDQYNNTSNVRAHFETTGPEIAEQTRGRITHFVAGLGTSGTLVGAGRYLRQAVPDVEIVAVEPDRPLHGIEGLKDMASSIVPGIYDPAVHRRTVRVNTEAAYSMARRLAREEGLLVGQSSGAAVVGALAVARHLDEGVVVVVCPDGADRYLSTAMWTDPLLAPPDLVPVTTRIAGGRMGEVPVTTMVSVVAPAGIVITQDQAAAMVEQARREAPHECCGLLAGRAGRAERLFRGSNVDQSPITRYRMADKEVHLALKEIDAAGQDLLAIYHSHTHSPAEPSSTDIAQAHYPDSLYLIISLKDPAVPVVRGFRIAGKASTEASVIVR